MCVAGIDHTLSCITLQNGKGVDIAKFLKYIWPFFNNVHERFNKTLTWESPFRENPSQICGRVQLLDGSYRKKALDINIDGSYRKKALDIHIGDITIKWAKT